MLTEVSAVSEQRLAGLLESGARHRARADFAAAEPLLREALSLAEQELSDQPLRVAEALNVFGLLCKDLARYDEGRAAYQGALALVEAMPAPDQHSIATLYHNLGGIEHARRNYADAEPLARTGLEIRRKASPPDLRALAADIVAFAAILDGQGKFEEAEALYVEALPTLERAPHANAHEIGVALNDLGAHYARRGDFERAAELLTRSVELKTRTHGAEHPDVALSLNNLAFVYERSGRLRQAVDLYAKAAHLFDAVLGPDHHKTLACRSNYERCARAVDSNV